MRGAEMQKWGPLRVGLTIILALAMMVLWVPSALAKPVRPANDEFKKATKIATLPFTDSINTSKATSASGDPTDCGPTNNSVWYVLTVQRAMTVAAGTFDSSYYANVAVYTGTQGALTQVTCDANEAWFEASAGQTYYVMVTSPFGGGGSLVLNVVGHVLPPNDDFDNATVISISDLPFSDTLDTVAATSAPDDPTRCAGTARSVWYAFTPSTDISVSIDTLASGYAADIAVYTGQRGQLIGPVACGFREAGFKATAGVTYYIMVTVNHGTGNLVFNMTGSLPPPPPLNDDFDAATVIPGLPYSDTLDTRGATTAPDEPSSCAYSDSVWYSLTPTVNQRIDLDTGGSSYGIQIGVFTGSRDALTQVACSETRVSFEATAGVTYHLQIVTEGPGGGDLVFNAVGHLPVPNDDFDNATTITSVPFSDTLDTTTAAAAPDDPTDCSSTNFHTVWYALTPPADMTLAADTSQSSYSAVICVYTGSRGALNQVTNGLQRVSFQATAGVTYYFMVADYIFSQGGNLIFQVQ
jgi:hypothetical protein